MEAKLQKFKFISEVKPVLERYLKYRFRHRHIGVKLLYNFKAPLGNSKFEMVKRTIFQNLYADDMVLISSNYDDLECLMSLRANYLERFV